MKVIVLLEGNKGSMCAIIVVKMVMECTIVPTLGDNLMRLSQGDEGSNK